MIATPTGKDAEQYPVIKRISNEEYHADHSALSKSMLNQLADDSVEYRDKFVTRVKPAWGETTDAQVLGDLVHKGLFEPDLFKSSYAIIPEEIKVRSSKSKAWKQFKEDHPGKAWIRQAELDRVHVAVRRSKEHGAKYLAPPGYVELSLYWICPYTGLLCKCRPDKFLLTELRTLRASDYKTTKTLDEFQRVYKKKRYWLQDAHYSDGFFHVLGQEPEDFVFLAQEMDGRQRFGEFRITDFDRERARSARLRLMETLLSHQENDTWEQEALEPKVIKMFASDFE